MILVVGGTGTTGREVVRLLTAAKAPLRVLVRSSKAAKDAKAQGTEAVVGDLEKPKTLDEALEGVQRAFVLSSASPDVPRLHGNLFAAAKRAGVAHVVRYGAIGASPKSPVSLLRWHGEADEALKASGLAWTLLRPHFFMQNFVNFYGGMIESQDAFYLPMGTGRISMVDVRDVAAVAAATLTKDGHEGQAYDLTGPEVLTMAEAAEKISIAAGRKITYVDVTPEMARTGMLHAKMPEPVVEGLIELYADYRAGRGAVLTSAIWDVTGRMPRTFESYLADHRAAFAKA